MKCLKAICSEVDGAVPGGRVDPAGDVMVVAVAIAPNALNEASFAQSHSRIEGDEILQSRPCDALEL